MTAVAWLLLFASFDSGLPALAGSTRLTTSQDKQDDLSVLKPEDQPRKMLYSYLEVECGRKIQERARAVATLKTPADVAKRQAEIRAKFLEALGPFPEKTPLNARVTGTLNRDGYRIEKVIYETRPRHHLTANLYLPEGKGPFPAVLFPCGHYGNPKAADEYQRACILLARNGLAALIFDPIGQGERHQVIVNGKPAAHGTSEHTLLDVGALLVGSCSANHFVWDGIRSLDYLQSRPEIDPKRLGCMGNSGGGTQTAYLMAVDDRVAAAVPNCFITSLEKLIATVGPQDGEANIPGQIAFGMGHADYFLLRAPRPSQLSCPTRDYYDIDGAWSTFREAKKVYGILGYSERMDMFEYDDKHSISRPFREAGVRWMRRWLLGVDDAPVEADVPVSTDKELQCTATGHVIRELDGRSAHDFTADRVRELESKREILCREDLLSEVRRLIALGPVTKAAASFQEPRNGSRIRSAVFETEPGIKVPALIHAPDAPKGRVLYVHGEGKAKAAVEPWLREGYEVVALDLRGMGETQPLPPHKGLANFFRPEWKEAYLAFGLQRPLLGQRVRDLLAVVAAFDEPVHVVGVGAAAPVALHAAALDPRITELTLENMVESWSLVARTAITRNQLDSVVPGALKVYDLPDLVAAISPRPVKILAPLDAAGKERP